MSLIPHGQRGRYVAGCRCPECKHANREYLAGWRERRRASKPAPPVPDGVGPLEATLTAELGQLVGSAPWSETLVALALVNARLLDRIPAMNAWQLSSPTQGRLLDVLDRLRQVTGASGGPPSSLEDFVNGLSQFRPPRPMDE